VETQDWPTLLVLCKDYYNSIKPHGLTKRDLSSPTFNCEAHQKKICQWFMNPKKYIKELAKEQQKYPDKCLYHLSKSHSTDDCHVKKECARLSNAHGSESGNTTNTPGQLCHLTEDIVEDAIVADDNDDCVEPIDNDTNEADLFYFVRVSNLYLCLVNNSSFSSSPRPLIKFPVIADSGANYHMFKEREF
jgi:hypothetical protein